MYDAREKAIRDQIWINNAVVNARKEALIEGKIKGEIKGEIKTIRILQEILNLPVNSEEELRTRTLEQLQSLTTELRNQFHSRPHN